MTFILKKWTRNNFATTYIYNKMYWYSEKLMLERTLPFFAAIVIWIGCLSPSALSAAEGVSVSTGSRAGELIKSRKAGDRHEALEQIRRRKGKISDAEMNSAFSKEKDPVLKTGMLRMIAATPGAAGTLIASLKTDPSPTVRQSAAQELGRYARDAAVVAALADALKKDKAQEVRAACALSLAFSDTPAADDALELASRDRDPNLRRQAAFSLKRHKSAKAAAVLKRLKTDPDASVRNMAGK